MTTTNPIAAYLKTYHKGAERVVSSRELEAAFQIRGPDLRRLINSLRGDGVPICSSASGYYYAGTEEELRRTIRQLRSRIKKIAHAGTRSHQGAGAIHRQRTDIPSAGGR